LPEALGSKFDPLNGKAIGVIFDGNKTVTTLHRSYLDLEDAG
jgi:hypothetical protein